MIWSPNFWRTDSILYSWKSSYLINRPGKISNCESLKKSSSRVRFLRKTLKSVWEEEKDGVNLVFLDFDMMVEKIKVQERIDTVGITENYKEKARFEGKNLKLKGSWK